MSDYIVCVRNIEKGAFGDEPGKTYFLNIPNQNNAIEISHKTTKKDWFESVLKKAVSSTEKGVDIGDILVFIHGYNNSQDDVLKRHRSIKASLKKAGYQGVVVSFDWPSNELALNYLEDRSDAKHTAIKLVDDCIKAFSIMQKEDCRINVHLLAHSTGAYVVREAFDDADDRKSIASANWSVSQIMLIGADISAASMSQDNAKSSSTYRHCIRLTNYSNPYDSALKLSNVKRVGVAPRAGRIGLPEEIPHNAINVDCGDYYNEHEDIIQTLGTKSHSWYIGNDAFTNDMLHTIKGNIDRHLIPTRNVRDGKLYLKKSND